ncbi:MAG: aldehyde dehydrogenase family protein [Dinoroseobacter sp.]|nr:aldehyde dehydrogenase family protein [Dinoroseobacter sp.]
MLKTLPAPALGHFVAPPLIMVTGIKDLDREVFGPVLHVATYAACDLDKIIAEINATGYGLTFGMHSRIDDRVEQVTSQIHCGNLYINRNQIGAIVGSQPFGGEGLSGTGPKAGGPNYVPRFSQPAPYATAPVAKRSADLEALQQALNAATPIGGAIHSTALPGPTGESNVLSHHGRGTVLCLGPGQDALAEQVACAKRAGCSPVKATGHVPAEALTKLHGFEAVLSFHDTDTRRAYRQALASRDGALLPLLSETDLADRLVHERHLCVDTTAAGGNVGLLSQNG